jgi:hypothetical protein
VRLVPESSDPRQRVIPMRSRIWSAPWFRLFLSLIVVRAVFSSPIRVGARFVTVAQRPDDAHIPRQNITSVHKHQSGPPVEVRRVRFVQSLQDPGDEIALDAPLQTWAFSIDSLRVTPQSPQMPSSLRPSSSLPLLC